ncbi:uncharacterized protein METZ01_LOCUS230263 [marine metagenome]|uniref:Uncharacterized protein n=1 Tax=marine metagenome TaxID=408172 RepID=A0A382GR08_9ZZZZ
MNKFNVCTKFSRDAKRLRISAWIIVNKNGFRILHNKFSKKNRFYNFS